jgi:hypothetical protein
MEIITQEMGVAIYALLKNITHALRSLLNVKLKLKLMQQLKQLERHFKQSLD